MHDKEEDLLFSKSLFLTVTLLLGCNKDEEDRIGNRGFCFRPVANPDVQTTFVVAAAVCILESVWLQRDVKEKRNARVLFSCFKTFCEDVCFKYKCDYFHIYNINQYDAFVRFVSPPIQLVWKKSAGACFAVVGCLLVILAMS